ncbi:hypothetical protein GCM10027080_21520 [Pedococcus soli]
MGAASAETDVAMTKPLESRVEATRVARAERERMRALSQPAGYEAGLFATFRPSPRTTSAGRLTIPWDLP